MMWRSLTWLLAAFAFAACDSAKKTTGADDQPGEITIELSQQELTIGVGSTVALQALVRDDAGRSVGGRAVFWSSSDTSVARVSSAGLVTALKPGTAQIAATVGGRSAVALLRVAPRAVASIQLSPLDPQLFVGDQLQLTARTLDATGAELSERSIEWNSSNDAVAVVNANGAITGVAAGFATISATSEGRSASVGVTVSLVPVATVTLNPAAEEIVVGQTVQLTATLRNSAGVQLDGRQVTWSTSNSSIASVSSSGLVLGKAPGELDVTATSEGKSASAHVVVKPRPVSSVIVSPAQTTLMVGRTVSLSVQVTDDNGNLLTGRPVQFQSQNASIATVNASGVVAGVSTGNTSIVVTSEGKSATVPVTVVAVPVAMVRVQPSSVDLVLGSTSKLTAVALDEGNNVLAQRVITWTSGSPTVATVASDGTVTAVGVGSAVVVASAEGRVGTATVNVRAVPVGTVVVTPAAANVIIGDALDLTFVARDASGNVLEGRQAFWTSTNDAIAAVSSAGRVVGISTGTVQIRASVDGVIGSSTINIIVEPVLSITVDPTAVALQPGKTQAITATPRGRNNVALTGRTVRFTSADPAIATVSESGVVTALKVGSTTITVESEGKQATVPVTITPVPVASVTVSLSNSALRVGQTAQASATIRDEAGNVLTGRSVTWSTSNASVAQVSQAGVVTALTPGAADITATVEGKTGSASVSVTLVPVATVAVTLTPSSTIPGQTAQATATVRDASGNLLEGRDVTWTSSNTNVATVGSDGLVTAKAPGTASITATSEGRSGSATLTVGNVPVASVSVSLNPASITVGSTSQATATVRDASGNILTGRSVSWSSSNTNVATVSSSGVVTAKTVGSAAITATVEGRTGSTTLAVTAVPVATVSVSLDPASVAAGGTSQASATLRDANGNVLTGRSVTWSSSDSDVASVNAAGLVTSKQVGTVTITATSEGKSGTATLTVTEPPVATVSVTLDPSTVVEGATGKATATLRTSNGTVVTGRSITWSSSNTGIATVDEDGVVTTLRPGTVTITAASEGRTGSASLQVQPAAVAKVEVTPETATIYDSGPQSGRRVQLTARAFDADGRELLGRTFTWSSSRTSVATVNSSGLVNARSRGTATITASTGGRSGTATITVRD